MDSEWRVFVIEGREPYSNEQFAQYVQEPHLQAQGSRLGHMVVWEHQNVIAPSLCGPLPTANQQAGLLGYTVET